MVIFQMTFKQLSLIISIFIYINKHHHLVTYYFCNSKATLLVAKMVKVL